MITLYYSAITKSFPTFELNSRRIDTMILQLMKEEDIPEIYGLFRENLQATTDLPETEIPSISNFTEKMINKISSYPTILLKEHGEIIGIALSDKCNDQSGCLWNCCIEICIRPEFRHQDLGKALLSAMIDILSLQGYYNVICYITLPDEETLRFFNLQGFTLEGINQNHEFKNGHWHDRAVLKRNLLAYVEPDRHPVSIKDISKEALDAVFAKGFI